MMGVLLDAGLAEFGDVEFLASVMEEIRTGTERGKLWSQGTARVGEHYKVRRTPVIKKQGISAYDPRVSRRTNPSARCARPRSGLMLRAVDNSATASSSRPIRAKRIPRLTWGSAAVGSRRTASR